MESVTSGGQGGSGQITWWLVIWYYVVPVAGVIAVVYILTLLQARAENAATEFARSVQLGTAFGAGIVASVNPCGFIMLPTYLSLQLGTQESGGTNEPWLHRVVSVVRISVATTMGFIGVVAPVGVLVALAGQALSPILPYAAVTVGSGMVGLALWLLVSGRKLGIAAASRVHVTPSRNTVNALLFRMTYSIASLSCALPIFLLVVSTALTSGGFLSTIAQFVSYALGMGTVITVVTVAAAALRNSLSQHLRVLMPVANHVGVLFLLGAGAYLIYYWVLIAPNAF